MTPVAELKRGGSHGEAELILRARGGDELAYRRLLDQHQGDVRFHVTRHFAPGLERDDFHQEALYGFHKAIRDYRSDRESSFRSFVNLCVERQVITALKTARRHKHTPLNDATSLSATVGDDEAGTLGDLLADPAGADPLDVLEARERMQAIASAMGDLSLLERQALLGAANGDPYMTIAADEGVGFKAIDNALQRARRKVAAALASPTAPPPPGPPPSPHPPRRRRRARRPRLVSRPRPAKEIRPVPSIVESVEAEISTVQEEIAELERQLDGRRIHLEGLNDLRTRAEALGVATPNGEGEGLPDPVPSATPSASRPSEAAPLGRAAGAEDRDRQVLAVIEAHPEDGVAPREIVEATGLSRDQVAKSLLRLDDQVEKEGARRSVRYFPKGTARPKPAPAERRALPAPARTTEPRRNQKAAEAHNALRHKVEAAVLEVLADRPMGSDRLNATVLERVPEATRDDVAAVRVNLARKTGQIEIRAHKVCLSGFDRTKPITNVEREVVGYLGSGRTAREVAAGCKLVRNAFSAQTILRAMAQRGVIAERPDSSPSVYEAIAEREAAA